MLPSDFIAFLDVRDFEPTYLILYRFVARSDNFVLTFGVTISTRLGDKFYTFSVVIDEVKI